MQIAEAAIQGQLKPTDLTVARFAEFLPVPEVPQPDLLIRTSGELRISNFLLWHLAYTEIVVVNELWPEFTHLLLLRCLAAFGKRDRRFGKTQQQIDTSAGSAAPSAVIDASYMDKDTWKRAYEAGGPSHRAVYGPGKQAGMEPAHAGEGSGAQPARGTPGMVSRVWSHISHSAQDVWLRAQISAWRSCAGLQFCCARARTGAERCLNLRVPILRPEAPPRRPSAALAPTQSHAFWHQVQEMTSQMQAADRQLLRTQCRLDDRDVFSMDTSIQLPSTLPCPPATKSTDTVDRYWCLLVHTSSSSSSSEHNSSSRWSDGESSKSSAGRGGKLETHAAAVLKQYSHCPWSLLTVAHYSAPLQKRFGPAGQSLPLQTAGSAHAAGGGAAQSSPAATLKCVHVGSNTLSAPAGWCIVGQPGLLYSKMVRRKRASSSRSQQPSDSCGLDSAATGTHAHVVALHLQRAEGAVARGMAAAGKTPGC